jgi:predicted DNA-binding WGR domain protein
MIYETKSGARYWVERWFPKSSSCQTCIIIKIDKNEVLSRWGCKHARQKPLREYFPDRESAETALKAYAEKHKWRLIEP